MLRVGEIQIKWHPKMGKHGLYGGSTFNYGQAIRSLMGKYYIEESEVDELLRRASEFGITIIEEIDKEYEKRFGQNPGEADPVAQAEMIAQRLADEIEAPFVNVQVSTLGGKERVSILMKLSLDAKETWVNGIFENSRYMHFHISKDGAVEQFTRQYTIPKKFRKIKVKSAEELAQKINKYLDSVR